MAIPSPDIAERLPPLRDARNDPLSEALHFLRLTGTLYCRSELSAPWGVAIPAFADAMTFVVVLSGSAWLEIDGLEPEYLKPMSLTLLPHGIPHNLRSEHGAPTCSLLDLPVEKISERYEVLQHGGGGPVTQAVYGVMRLDHIAAQRLVTQLPAILQVDALTDDLDGWLETTINFIMREASNMKPGGETVITHLADILVIQAIRSWIDRSPDTKPGWLAALRDGSIGRALSAFHKAPERDWTVAKLAQTAGMSRSTFSERFSSLLGQSVMQYVTLWRMQLARQLLRETVHPLADIAPRVGYRSEAAFCRAYRRVYGEAPGRLRFG